MKLNTYAHFASNETIQSHSTDTCSPQTMRHGMFINSLPALNWVRRFAHLKWDCFGSRKVIFRSENRQTAKSNLD